MKKLIRKSTAVKAPIKISAMPGLSGFIRFNPASLEKSLDLAYSLRFIRAQKRCNVT
ncbi:hypothetical protein [Nitrosospira sp. Nl5]|uniref:hypothetical protein n=1 Tax=Nitrosospira sp. Nl5 TaxID=200120 RepID=UPI0015A32C9B|nr:hypothetical protein [Nitrosospira sp. Nl5]